ncbi:hypothetical protein KDW_42670 [Dictyobacter vulcani]|uniref:Uncharacterized protein n=1 Tax=Dictyobacter vulcani TaxID=2607529 RepID=A0A5J4KQG3_9CHLR|nr:hypothetical protein [Dictyobacter vulcani]GER90105.1 hypothetical protein KDW_42670 [Dictyobacter vulcani]
MPMLVHLTAEKNVKPILRGGIKSSCGVYSMPMLQNHYISHQWLRELKRRGQRTYMAVYFRVSAEEIVSVGHYNQQHQQVPLGKAIEIIRNIDDAQGYEIIISRTITKKEIVKVRALSQIIGWRYMPFAHGKSFFNCPGCIPRGQIKSKVLQQRYRQGITRSGSGK